MDAAVDGERIGLVLLNSWGGSATDAGDGPGGRRRQCEEGKGAREGLVDTSGAAGCDALSGSNVGVS